MIYFGYFFFSFIDLEWKRQIRLYAIVVPSRFQTIMVKIYTRFQTKTAQKPYSLGRHIPI